MPGSPKKARERFAEIISRPDEEIDLAEAALLIAAEEYPGMDVGVYLDRLDYFADLVGQQVNKDHNALDIITALNATLFERLGFQGNRESYYDPRNSYLNEVIDRRTGIPITLTVLYIEVARRIGFSIKGVGMPFHFLAKHHSGEGDLFIDPFNSGRLFNSAGCEELLAQMSGRRMELRSEHLTAVTNKQILARMLSNLMGIYSAGDYRRALSVIDRLLLINPESVIHRRDRGLLLAKIGDRRNAIAELEMYVEQMPDAADIETVREEIRRIRQSLARLN